jgi:hypothetical protein
LKTEIGKRRWVFLDGKVVKSIKIMTPTCHRESRFELYLTLEKYKYPDSQCFIEKTHQKLI